MQEGTALIWRNLTSFSYSGWSVSGPLSPIRLGSFPTCLCVAELLGSHGELKNNTSDVVRLMVHSLNE